MNAKSIAPPRADVALVARQLFPSRAKAQEAIAAGLVRANGTIIRKASEPILPSAEIEAAPAYPWVSCGGVKLAAALDAFGFDSAGRVCLDAGASTGGFTHVLLTRGAAEVICVDCGHGQLNPDIANDPRVLAFDPNLAGAGAFAGHLRCELHIAHFGFTRFAAACGGSCGIGRFDQAAIRSGSRPRCQRHRQRQGGTTRSLRKNRGWHIAGIVPSPIEGGDGNQEFLLGAWKG